MSVVTMSESLEDMFKRAIESAIAKEAMRIAEKYQEQMREEFEKSVREAVLKVAVNMTNLMTFERNDRRLIVTIEDRRGGGSERE